MTTPLLTYAKKNSGIRVDLDTLVRSRMLIQANSGGGKSWALRQLLEETFGRVQHIVLDPEGEYATLREAFDYVLAAKHGGDVEATPRTARVLCRRIMETSASAVIDLYDLKIPERRDFVKIFLTELLALPKDLRRPLLVVLDEAHVFAPEGAKSDALEAVMTLASQGRKRGYALVCATQRLSKLSKDVAAELLTRLIGRTGLDLDVKRAGDELGFDKESRAALPTMEPGTFYAFGPALPPGPPRLVRTGAVKTSHPQPGAIEAPTPPPSAKVKQLLAKSLADLPQQAVEEARTLAELQKANAILAKQIRQAGKPAAIVHVERKVVDDKAIDRAVAAAIKPYWAAFNGVHRQVARAVVSLRQGIDLLEKLPPAPTNGTKPHAPAAGTVSRIVPPPVARPVSARIAPTDFALGKGEQSVLRAIAQHDEGVTRKQLTVLTGYKRSTRNVYLQRLSAAGYIAGDGETIRATDEGVSALGAFEPLPTGDALREHWLTPGRLPEGEQKILALVCNAWPEAVERDRISDETNYLRSTRNVYLQRLQARKLVLAAPGGAVKANPNLFDA